MTLLERKYIIDSNNLERGYKMSNEKEKKNTSGLAVAGFVLGIIAILGSFIPIINNASFVFGLIGLILAFIGIFKSSKKALPIVAVILCVLSMVITLSLQKQWGDALDNTSKELNQTMGDASGDNTERILSEDADVKLGELSISKDEYGLTKSELKVNVTNKTSEKKSFNFTIEAVDASGNRIMVDYVYANELAAGQSAEYKVFEYIEDDKVDAMKTATIKVSSASMY